MMKRIFAALLTVALATTLTACGGSNATATNSPTGNRQPSSAVVSEPKPANPTDTDLFDPPLVDNIDEPTNVGGNAVATEAPTGTDASSYWQGSDFFDVIGYLKANGATDIANGVEELPVNGELQRCYWETNCKINGWHLRINWMDGQIVFKNSNIDCYCGQELNPTDFITGSENGSPIPRQCISYLVSSLDYILSTNPNTTNCPYCGLDVNDPMAEAGVVNDSPFPHTHDIVPQQ